MKREDLFESIEKQIIAEKVYRAQIRKKLGEFKVLQEAKAKRQLVLEKLFRKKLREDLKSLTLLPEAKKSTYIHNTTGMNALEDLFSNTNLLSVLESDYKILTTSYEQRRDYRERIMQLVLSIFSQENLKKDDETKSLKESLHRLYEQDDPDIQITVDDDDLPDDKVVGPKRDEMEKEKEEQKKEDSENADAMDKKEDATGVRRAELAFKKIENSIKTAYETLGNPADQQEFKRFLIANLGMYFKRFEEALSNEPKADIPDDAQQAIEDAEAKLDSEETEGTEDVGGSEEDEEMDLDLGF
jgi:hypothetical protein